MDVPPRGVSEELIGTALPWHSGVALARRRTPKRGRSMRRGLPLYQALFIASPMRSS